MANPRDPIYATIDEAAIAALDEIMPMSIAMKQEFSFAVYKDNHTLLYGFTDFVTDGNKASVGNAANFGTDFIANGHTHPNTPKQGYLPHHISNHKATCEGFPAYWIAPNGTVHVYEPSKNKRRIVRVHHLKPNIVH